MSWTPDEHEVITTFQLTAEQRYKYLLKKMVREQTVWTLGVGNGFVVAGDQEGNETMPLWPHARYALVCASGEWGNCHPREISLASWLNHWLPGLEKDKKKVAAFPSLDGKGAVIDPAQMATDLKEKLEKL